MTSRYAEWCSCGPRARDQSGGIPHAAGSGGVVPNLFTRPETKGQCHVEVRGRRGVGVSGHDSAAGLELVTDCNLEASSFHRARPQPSPTRAFMIVVWAGLSRLYPAQSRPNDDHLAAGGGAQQARPKACRQQPCAEHNHQTPTRSQIVTSRSQPPGSPPRWHPTREHALLHGIGSARRS
jgi:hypothetical protein